MYSDCHIHMILDGVYYRAAIDHQRERVDEGLVRSRLAGYQKQKINFLRDGGDAWGVGLFASRVAEEYGITYRTPVFPICRRGHYGEFIGKSFSDMAEYKALIAEVKRRGGHFVKIMVSGIMDFNRFGGITDSPCPLQLVKEMVAIANDAGFSVMAHANGVEAVSAALTAGVDSIEHGAYLDQETLHQLAESGAVWVPTLAAIANLRGLGRFPDTVLDPLVTLQQENVAYAAALGAKIASGSDAGAYAVPHGKGAMDELALLREALGGRADAVLAAGERAIRGVF